MNTLDHQLHYPDHRSSLQSTCSHIIEPWSFTLLSHSLMELSPSWEAANCAATRRVQVMKHLIMQFSPTSCHVISVFSSTPSVCWTQCQNSLVEIQTEHFLTGNLERYSNYTKIQYYTGGNLCPVPRLYYSLGIKCSAKLTLETKNHVKYLCWINRCRLSPVELTHVTHKPDFAHPWSRVIYFLPVLMNG
jgi:hypothetical protein